MPGPVGSDALADHLSNVAEAAEAAGFDQITVMDHFFALGAGEGAYRNPMLEAYTALGFIAARTARLRVGSLVTGVTYRYPGILIKQVTTLNVLSKGRGFLGIGAAWHAQEHGAFGVPFPPLKERFERLEETLQIAHQAWRGDSSPFSGKYYQLAEPLLSPEAVTKPRPRILIGGSGEQKTLRLVAQYADACHINAPDIAALQHKLAVLEAIAPRWAQPRGDRTHGRHPHGRGFRRLERPGGDRPLRRRRRGRLRPGDHGPARRLQPGGDSPVRRARHPRPGPDRPPRSRLMALACAYLIVTGTTTAPRAMELVHALLGLVPRVITIMTPNAGRVIAPRDLSVIQGNRLVESYFDPAILPRPPDGLVLVAPCSFNSLNKLAAGIADNLALSVIAEAIGRGTPVIVAPSLNAPLLAHPRAVASLATLTRMGRAPLSDPSTPTKAPASRRPKPC